MSDWDVNFLLNSGESWKSELPDGGVFFVGNATTSKIYFKIEPNDPVTPIDFQYDVEPSSQNIYTPENYEGEIVVNNESLNYYYLSGATVPFSS